MRLGSREKITAVVAVALAVLAAVLATTDLAPWSAAPEEKPRATSAPPDALKRPRHEATPATDELLDRTVTVSGFVIDDLTGKPIGGAKISVVDRGIILRTETDAAGEWRLDLHPNAAAPHHAGSLRTPRHEVRAAAGGYAPEIVSFELVPVFRRQQVDHLRLARVAARLTVQVVDATGGPALDAMVHVELPSTQGRGVRRITRPAPGGALGPIAIGAGRLVVRARAPGQAEGMVQTFLPPGEPVDRTVTVVLPPSDPATVRVIDAEGMPVAGVTIRLLSWGERSYRTDRQGRLRIPLPREGSEECAVESGAWICLERWITLRAGLETTVVVERPAALTGRMTFEDGTPLPSGIRLWVADETVDRPLESEVRPGGRFDLRPLYPGQVQLTVMNGMFILAQFPFSLAPGEIIDGLEIRVAPNHAFTGTVRDAPTGQPIVGVRVGASHSTRYTARGVVTDGQGRFRFPVATGLFDNWQGSLGFAADGYLQQAVKVTNATTSLDVRLQPTEVIYGEDRELVGPPTDLTIQVLDEEGEPVAGAWLEVSAKSHRRQRYFTSDEAGWIQATADELMILRAPGRTAVRLPGGARGELKTPLPPSAPIRVRVLDGAGRPAPGAWVNMRSAGWSERVFTDLEGRARFEGLLPGTIVEVESESEAWAQAGGDEVVLRRPPTATARVRVTKPGAVTDLESCETVSLQRVTAERNLLPLDLEALIVKGGCDLFVRAEPAVLSIQMTGGPQRVTRIDPAAGEVIEVPYDPSPTTLGPIRVEDHRGDPVSGAELKTLAGQWDVGRTDAEGRARSEEPEEIPFGVVRLVVITDDRAPIVTAPIDVENGALIRLPPMGELSGRVTIDGKAARGRVRVHSALGVPAGWINTDAGGRFEIKYAIPEGNRRIEVRVAGHLPHFEDVRIHAGIVNKVLIRLP